MAIKYGGKTTPDYSAMQGPAPDGFHVPLNTEWQAVYDIWTALGGGSSDGANFGIALKLPFAGYRIFSTAEVGSQGSDGCYWSSSRYDTSNAYYLYFHSTTLGPQNNNRRPNGYSVRCFKNSPTVPTSSWTKLYGTSIEAGGIFWSSTDGLISLSSDGNTWITIADKNLGATTVWNSGDTLSETNAGKYYQRGNNYGFPRARNATITISYTQVDASTYGPGNYYSSSTFIGRSRSPHRWDTTDNGNLRGGVTGVQQRPAPIKKRYYGGKIIKDIQGPAPYGFHIPTVDEREGLYDIMSGLYLSSGEDWQENLHIPLASYRTSSGDIYQYPDMGVYWSSSPNTNSQNNAYCLDIRHNNVGPNVSTRRSYGLTVRAFSDSYIEATSDWTVINGDIGYPGIFWNQSEGLITISDGTWGYTIMDKNLGATTVYNYGDVLTDANVGYMYQWGNNYGFPATGTISKTSSTQVDASTYGPTNPYSSDTFITGSYDWSSVHNDNLWGGVTKGHRPAEVKKVYYGSTQIRPSGGLPSAYQEVEYIESSGTQYFIVGSSFRTDYKSVIDLEMSVIGGDYIPLGVHNDAGFRYGIDAYGGKFTAISGGGGWTDTVTEDTNRHLITIDQTTAIVDGISYNINYTYFAYNKGIGVFGYHNTLSDGVSYRSSNKLYKLDIYDGSGTQINDLVPCYRKSDTEIGMYDLINDVFYTNQGTGTFTKGPDV